jgi:hypothetical protein
MAEDSLPLPATPRRLRLEWVSQVLFRPRQAFKQIMEQASGVWLTPLLILSLSTTGRVLANGWLKSIAAAGGSITLPPGFEYYSPEQQAQFQQAMQATSGPVFVYVFPVISGVLGTWVGWLLVSGLIRLVMTMLGGRGDTGSTTNLVAWASLPFAVRDLVRLIAMLSTRQMLQATGLEGFAPVEATKWNAYLAAFLALVDIYMIWHIVLLVIGVRASSSLTAGKAWIGVTVSILLVLALQALLRFLVGQLSGMTVISPFF